MVPPMISAIIMAAVSPTTNQVRRSLRVLLAEKHVVMLPRLERMGADSASSNRC
jgi:hypothetical protein